MTLFRGLAAFPPTPTDAAGEVDASCVAVLVDKLAQAQVDSIGLLGSTGGYAYLTRDQRRTAVEAAVESAKGRVPLVVGVGALRTDAAVALAEDARALGADGLLLAPMSYTPLTDEEVFRHVAAVARAGRLPLCLYNNPTTTHFTFGPALIARLAKLEHVAAIKMPLPASGDVAGELATLRDGAPDFFAVGYSGDWGAADALLAGADAWYSVVAGLLPKPALALTRAAQAGNAAEARRIDDAFQPMWTLFRQFGSFRVMHMMADVLGFGPRVPPRPILPVPEDERGRVETAVRAAEAVV